eukprot:9971698-Heterocapsa_arctica.AAC.1
MPARRQTERGATPGPAVNVQPLRGLPATHVNNLVAEGGPPLDAGSSPPSYPDLPKDLSEGRNPPGRTL